MVLKLTGKFPEQPVPQHPIEASVEWLNVGVSSATGRVVFDDGTVCECRLLVNKYNDAAVQIGADIHPEAQPDDGRWFRLPPILKQCEGRMLQFHDDAVGRLGIAYVPPDEWGWDREAAGEAAYAEILVAALDTASADAIFVSLGGYSIEEVDYFQRPDLAREDHQAALDWKEGGRVGPRPW